MRGRAWSVPTAGADVAGRGDGAGWVDGAAGPGGAVRPDGADGAAEAGGVVGSGGAGGPSGQERSAGGAPRFPGADRDPGEGAPQSSGSDLDPGGREDDPAGIGWLAALALGLAAAERQPVDGDVDELVAAAGQRAGLLEAAVEHIAGRGAELAPEEVRAIGLLALAGRACRRHGAGFRSGSWRFSAGG